MCVCVLLLRRIAHWYVMVAHHELRTLMLPAALRHGVMVPLAVLQGEVRAEADLDLSQTLGIVLLLNIRIYNVTT